MTLISIFKLKQEIILTTEIIPREKCRFCKVYLAKGCLNDICLECSKKNVSFYKERKVVSDIEKMTDEEYISWRNVEGNKDY